MLDKAIFPWYQYEFAIARQDKAYGDTELFLSQEYSLNITLVTYFLNYCGLASSIHASFFIFKEVCMSLN